jgi:hypothetical protein
MEEQSRDPLPVGIESVLKKPLTLRRARQGLLMLSAGAILAPKGLLFNGSSMLCKQ